MKFLLLILLSVIVFFSFTNSSCKKDKINRTCGCAATDTKYILQNINGSLSYNNYNNQWMISYSPLPGNYSNYFPCNITQDSLKVILQGANHNDVINVKFSGKVKVTCPGESFGITTGVTTFDYIIIDSLKRN